ncbi:MAG: phage tail tape measure C-terminal domain-containing protein [Bacteroidota bacterium]
MSTQTLEFILKMRDEATAHWNRFKNRIERDTSALGRMMSGIGGILAGVGALAGMRAAITASNEQEQATTRLSSALQNAGIWSANLQHQMEQLSTSYQKTTRFSDETVTSVQAMLVAMTGLAGDAVAPLVQATLDLASGMQMDAEQAASMVGRAIAGGSAVGRMGIQFDKNATSAEKVAKIIEVVNQRFGNLAQREGAAASGRLAILNNQFGELLETMGDRLKEMVVPLFPALNAIITIAGKVVNILVFGLSAGFAMLFGQIAFVGMNISAMLEKIGLSTKEKTAWYRHMWESGTTRANEYSQKLLDVFKSEEVSTSKISAKGKALNEAGDAADKLAIKMEKLAGQEIEFINEEQAERFENAAKRAEHIAKFLAQSLALRRDLIAEDLAATAAKPMEGVTPVEPVSTESVARLTEFEEKMVKIQDLSSNAGRIMMNAFDSGVDTMVDAMVNGTEAMGAAFSKFARRVIADLLAMIAKAAIWKLIMFGLDVLSGGTGFFTQFGKAAIPTANEGAAPIVSPSLARAGFASAGGPTMNVNLTVQAMDARSVREWLGKTDVRASIVQTFRDAWDKEKA